MADIGPTLREARMRQRSDLPDMEVETKIRAKYLRALENEEWDQLPGPTFVKSFLRTYAEALGLDAKRIVEEYKVRHERLADADLPPIRPGGRDRGRRGGEAQRGGVPRWALVGVVFAGILAALYALGQAAEDPDEARLGGTPPAPQSEPAPDRDRERDGEDRPQRPRAVSLRLVPTGPVSVCLVDARGRVLVDDEILTPGNPTRTFRSRRFRMVVGNNLVRVVVNRRARTLPASSGPIARQVSASGVRTLPAADRPSCS